MDLALLMLALVIQAADPDPVAAPVVEDPPDPPGREVDQPPSPTNEAPILRPLNPDRPPLLREGTLLTRAPGTVVFDDRLGCWKFTNEVLAGRSNQTFQRDFYLMPSRVLQEFIQHRASNPGMDRFEFSGVITIYDGVNFLLPSVITPMVEPSGAESRKDASVQEPTAQEATEEADSPPNTLSSDSQVIADRLEVRLQDRIGFLPMSLDLPQVDSGSDGSLIADGTRIQNRPGFILRDQNSGTWRFIFGAQGAGYRDPSLELLPGLLLQDIERLAMRSDLPPRIHASGQVTTFNGTNFLMLSRWTPSALPSNLVR